jgi:glycosyltransferase involved in cell wall biosynthesis
MPTVSVIIPSYNHERFVEECIQSVLNQTYQDFEIIITDDASIDRTVELIEQFKDSRIKLFRHLQNKGASVAANNCVAHSRGKYIAMLSSDDAWYPEKLEVQVKYLEQHPEIGAVFGKVEWVDETSHAIENKNFPYKNVFEVRNRSRFEWLNHFFYKGNCLCHPCSLVRRKCYQKIGSLNPDFANIPDFDLWIRLCLHYEIAILDHKLIRFRRMADESNASGDTNTSRIRNRFEHRHALNNYLQITNTDDFLRVFPESINYGPVTSDTIPFLLGRMAIKNIDKGMEFAALWGLDLIYNSLQNEKTARNLEENFNFTHQNFIALSGKCDPFRVSIFSPPLSSSQIFQQSVIKIFLSATKEYLKTIYLLTARVIKKILSFLFS